MRVVLAQLLVGAWLLGGVAAAQEGARSFGDEEAPEEEKVGVLTKAPVLVEFAEAAYPEAAMAEGLTASVELIITIDADGSVSEAVLAGALVGSGFDESALEAARRLRFEPAEIDGQPAAIRVPYVYRFEFQPPPEPEAEPEAAPPPKGRLIGRVRQKGTGVPIGGAELIVEPLEMAIYADARGRFESDVPPGSYVVVVRAPDHREQRIDVEIAHNEEVELVALIPPRFGVPSDVVIRGKRQQTSLTRRTLEGEQLQSVPGSFGDPLRAIQNLPGITRPPFVLGVLLVRGSAPGDSAVFVDGHEIPLIYHFLGGPSILAPDFLASIDFYPGNFSARYGRAIGGILDVETRAGNPKRWRGTADVDFFDAGAYAEGPIGEDTTVAFGLRRSYIDAFLRGAQAASDQEVAVVLPVYYDYQARADHRLNPKHRLGLLVFGSEDSLELVGDPAGSGPDSQDISARVAFHRVKFDWKASPRKGLSWQLSPVVGVDITRFESGEVSGDLTAWEYAGRFDVQLQIHPDLRLDTGIDVLGRQVILDASVPLNVPDYRPYPGTNPGDRETSDVERSFNSTGAAAYAELTWDILGGPVQLIPGVRLDTFHYIDQHRYRLDPRFNVRYAVHRDWTLKGGVGLFNQLTSEFRLDPEFGNPEVELERAVHYGLGFEWQATPAVSIDLTGFYLERFDLVRQTEGGEVETAEDESGETVLVSNPSRLDNIADGRAYGMELLVKHEMTKRFYGWISYTLSRSEQRSEPGAEYDLFPLDQTHIMNAVASYKLPSQWEVGVRFRLVSGNPDTPVEGGTFDGDRGNYEESIGREFSTRQELFDQLDIRVEKTWLYDLWSLSAYMDIQNVYNALNPEFTTYDYRFRESAPVPGIPILPTFGVKGRF